MSVSAESNSWTHEERAEDQEWHLKNMSIVRQLMAHHYQTYWIYFRGDKGLGNAAETADGQPLAAFKGTMANIFKRVRDKIYNQARNSAAGISAATSALCIVCFGLWFCLPGR